MKTNEIINYFGGLSATARALGMTVKEVCDLKPTPPKEVVDKAIKKSNGKLKR